MDAEIASEFQNLIFRMDETAPSRLQNVILG